VQKLQIKLERQDENVRLFEVLVDGQPYDHFGDLSDVFFGGTTVEGVLLGLGRHRVYAFTAHDIASDEEAGDILRRCSDAARQNDVLEVGDVVEVQ
jgi:hypothetical protein